MNTVTFGKRQRFKFIAAGTVKECQVSPGAGIYAVTYKQNPDSRPKSHTVVYFGEASDFSLQLATIRNDIRNWWHEHGHNDDELFMFIHPMPGSSQHDRAKLQHQLVLEYDPHGNE